MVQEKSAEFSCKTMKKCATSSHNGSLLSQIWAQRELPAATPALLIIFLLMRLVFPVFNSYKIRWNMKHARITAIWTTTIIYLSKICNKPPQLLPRLFTILQCATKCFRGNLCQNRRDLFLIPICRYRLLG